MKAIFYYSDLPCEEDGMFTIEGVQYVKVLEDGRVQMAVNNKTIHSSRITYDKPARLEVLP